MISSSVESQKGKKEIDPRSRLELGGRYAVGLVDDQIERAHRYRSRGLRPSSNGRGNSCVGRSGDHGAVDRGAESYLDANRGEHSDRPDPDGDRQGALDTA